MSDVYTYIVIPARYGSTRFPGKPLARIGNKTLLGHVCHAAQQVAKVKVLVATDDDRILQHARDDLGVTAVMTPIECQTGTDRVWAAVQEYEKLEKPAKPVNFIINLQGDSPLTPPQILQSLKDALQHHQVVTPIIQLSWEMLDVLRKAKLSAPFSGTLVTFNENNDALYFSKEIIPAIRDEQKYRNKSPMSPVHQHVGIYGYTRAMLEKFVSLKPTEKEKLEGLEQLRLLDHGFKINVVKVDQYANAWRGVDTPADLEFVAKILEGKQ